MTLTTDTSRRPLYRTLPVAVRLAEARLLGDFDSVDGRRPRGERNGSVILLLFLSWSAAVVLVPDPAFAESAGHDVEISTFATIMAVTRTAAERCEGVVIDETVIAAAKDRLHIVDDEYFAFRTRAHRLAETLQNDMVLSAEPSWCGEAFRRFGPDGTEVKGALRR